MSGALFDWSSPIRPALALGLLCALMGCRRSPPPPANVIGLETQTVAGQLDPPRPAPLTGVNAGPLHVSLGNPSVDRLDVQDASSEYAGLGVTSVRTHDNNFTLDIDNLYLDTENYSASPTDDDNYNWEDSEIQFQAIVDAGMSVYLRIGGSASDATGGEVDFLPTSPMTSAQWETFVGVCLHIVEHFIEGWKTNDEGELYTGPILGIEIWNEPNNPKFWNLGDALYVDLYVELLETLNSRQAGVRVGGPGFGWGDLFGPGSTDTNGNGVSDLLEDFIDDVVAHPGFGPRESRQPAFFSWHMYGSDPLLYTKNVRVVEAEIERFKDDLNARLDEREIGIQLMENHVTEWNTKADDDVNRGNGIACAQLTGAWICMQREGVDRSMFHRGWDEVEKPGGELGGYGLLTFDDDDSASRQRKPIGDAFDLWSDFAGEGGEFLHSTPSIAATDLYHLAQDIGGSEYQVLLANTGKDDIEYHIQLPGTTTNLSASSMTIEQIDADGVRSSISPSSTPITLPSNSVQLVRIG